MVARGEDYFGVLRDHCQVGSWGADKECIGPPAIQNQPQLPVLFHHEERTDAADTLSTPFYAADLGEGPVMSFLRVTLPLSMPGVIVSSLLVFIPTTGDYVTPNLVGGPTGIMIGNIVVSLFGNANNWPLGATTAVMSMLFIALLVCIFLWLSKLFRERVA